MADGIIAALQRGLSPRRVERQLMPATGSVGPWIPVVREPYPGAWQRGQSISQASVLASSAVFACITLIASDIAKLRVKLVQLGDDGVWKETANPAYSPVLRKPNPVQTRNQFWEAWILSKLLRGNAYVLKRRDQRRVVVGLYVLSPDRVKPLVADDGSLFYDINADNIAGLDDNVIVPAREIIHDRWNCLYHPLVGVSPIYACGLAATQALRIQEHSAQFFANAASPGGVLTSPGQISQITAEEMRDKWQAFFTGSNAGRIAILGNGLKFEPLTMTAVDSQLIEQLKMTAEIVCSVFHVPPYKIGVGEPPKYDNIGALGLQYYAECLQGLIEAAETCLDEGLDTGPTLGTEFDLEGLLRMDAMTQAEVGAKLTGAGIYSPNEARRVFSLSPVAGGDTPFLQQQYWPVGMLAARKAPPETSAAPAPAAPAKAVVPKIAFDMVGDRTLRMTVGEGADAEHSFHALPIPIDKGVWTAGVTYARGDGVTRKGSWWIATRYNPGIPGTEDSGWRLAVKAGKDAKETTR